MPSGSDVLDALDTLHVAVEGVRDKTIGLFSRAARRRYSWRLAGYNRVIENEHSEDVLDEASDEKNESRSGDFPPMVPGPMTFFDKFRVVNGLPGYLLEVPRLANLSKSLSEELSLEQSENDPNGITCCEFSSDSTRIVAGYQNGAVRVWNTLRGVLEFEKLELHSTHVTDVTFMGNQRHLVASIDLTGRYHMWDLDNGSMAYVNCQLQWREEGVEKPVVGRPHFEHEGLKVVVAVERRSPVAGPSRETDTGERETARGIEFYISETSTIPVFHGKAIARAVPEGSKLIDFKVAPSGACFFASFVPHVGAQKNLEGWTIVWPRYRSHPAANLRLGGGLAAWSAMSDFIVTWSPPLPSHVMPRYAALWRVASSMVHQTEIVDKTIVKDPAGKNICWCEFVSNYDQTLARTLACCVWTPGQEISVIFYDIVHSVFTYSITTGVDPAPNSWPLGSWYAWEEMLKYNTKHLQSVGLTHDRSWMGIFTGNEYKGMIVNGAFGVQELDVDVPMEFRWAIGSRAGILMGHTPGTFALVGSDSILVMHPRTVAAKPGQLAEALVCEDVIETVDSPMISQFSGNGRLLGVLRMGSPSLHIWDLEGGRMHSADVNGHVDPFKLICCFAISFQGDQIVTLSRDHTVTLWELFGEKLNKVGMIATIGRETSSSMAMSTMGFTRNAAGAKAIVVCDHQGDLIWIINAAPRPAEGAPSERSGMFARIHWGASSAKKVPKRGPFSTVKLFSLTERGMGKHSCRFSADGEKGLLMPNPQRVEVWDLVNRNRTHAFEFKVPLKVGGRASACQGVDMSGVSALVGAWTDWEDLVFCNPGTTAEELDKKVTELSDHLVISENGRWILTDGFHPSDEKQAQSQTRKAIYLIDKNGECETRILRGHELRPSQILNISPDGRWVICAAQQDKIRIWSAYATSGIMPTYRTVALDQRDDDKEFMEALLDKFGPALFNLLDPSGMTMIMHAVADLNFGLFRTMMDWGLKNAMKVRFRAICGQDYVGPSGERPCKMPTNAIIFAIQRRSPDFVRRIYDALVKGLVHEHEKAFILQESLVDISNTYPAIMEDVLNDDRIFTDVCKIEMPEEVFRQLQEEVVTVTDNRLTAPAHEIQHDWDKRNEGVHGIRVPAQVRSIAYPYVAQIGFKGLLSPLLVGRAPSSAFSSPIVRYIINYKWQDYAKRLVVNEMLHYVLMLAMFTGYCFIMGSFNWHTQRAMLRHWAGILATVLLLSSAFFALLNFLREVQQIRIHVTASGWKGLLYYGDSAWNWTEIGTYILLVFAIPTVHFKGSPQDNVTLTIILATEAILLWWKILYYMRAFKATGPLVIFIGNIIANIITFLVLAFMVLFGFGVAFFVLFRHVVRLTPEVRKLMKVGDEELEDIELAFGTLGQTLVTMFAFTLGDFDLEVLYNVKIDGVESPGRFTGIIFFVVYMFAIAVIILNLLIAVMGDSYDRVKNAQEMAFFKAKAVAIHDVETMMSAKTRGEKRASIKCYLHIVEPVVRIKDEDAEHEWQGRVLDLQRRFRRIIKTQMSKTTDGIKDIMKVSNETAGTIQRLEREFHRRQATVEPQGGSSIEDSDIGQQ